MPGQQNPKGKQRPNPAELAWLTAEAISTAKVRSQQPDEGIKIPGWAYHFATLRTLSAFAGLQSHEVHTRTSRNSIPKNDMSHPKIWGGSCLSGIVYTWQCPWYKATFI
jgi:hypothetical protein